MKPFNQLTAAGRTRRLRQMALQALTHYALPVARLTPVTMNFNSIFRIVTTDGRRFALRINYPGERNELDIASEMAWLDAIRHDTELSVPEPLMTRNGRFVVTVQTPGVPEPRHCVIFSWLNGRNIGRQRSPRIMRQLGNVMAQLHNHAEQFTPPARFTQKRYDEAFYFGTPAPIFSDEPDPLFTPERRHLLRQATERVTAYLEQLYTRPGQLFLHADMHGYNAKIHRGTLQLFDFDDSMWCYPVQDVGISFYYLSTADDFTAVRRAFRQGYEAERPWPEQFPGEIDLCRAHRTLDLLSFLIKERETPEFKGVLDRYVPRAVNSLQSWLETAV